MSKKNFLEVPPLQDGVLGLGDLWDARTSRRVGFNLFGNNLTYSKLGGKYVDVESSTDPSIYEMEHTKTTSDSANMLKLGAEISCALLGGMVKITGGLDFEIGKNQELSQEEIQKIIQLHFSRAKLKQVLQGQVFDKKVEDLLKAGGKLQATHVVTEVELGGSMLASIKISQLNKGNTYKVGAFLRGEISLGPVGAKLEANAEVGEDVQTSNYSKTIKVTSMPPIREVPTELKDVDFIDKDFYKAAFQHSHYRTWKGEPRGLPVKYFLVPISNYVNIEDPPESSDPSTEDQEQFAIWLGQLRDWIGADFLKRAILDVRPQMQKIMSETTHQISIDIDKRQVDLTKSASEFRDTTITNFLLLKEPDSDVDWGSSIYTPLETFCNAQETDITEFIKIAQESANAELIAVNVWPIDDPEQPDKPEDPLEEKTSLVFFTSQTELDNWLTTSRFVKILYKAKIGQDTNGIPQRLYNISVGLGKILIQPGISYPTLTSRLVARNSVDTSILTFKSSRQTLHYSDAADLYFVLDILEACTSSSQDPQSYHLYAAYTELLGSRLEDNQREDVLPLLLFLKEMFGGIKICKDQAETLNEMRKEDDTLKLVTTADGIRSTRYVLHTLLSLRSLMLRNPSLKVELISGTFNLRLTDSPMLFVCLRGKLKAICLDQLDLLIFLNQMESDSIEESSILSPSEIDKPNQNHFCPKDRVDFALKVRDLFPQKEIEDSVVEDIGTTGQGGLIETALDVITGILSSLAPGGGLVPLANAVARHMRKQQGFNNFLDEHWDSFSDAFKSNIDSEGWGYIAAILGYTEHDSYIYLKDLQEVIAITSAYKYQDNDDNSPSEDDLNDTLDGLKQEPPLTAVIESIKSMDSKATHIKAKARLYTSALTHALQREESKFYASAILSVLKLVINGLASSVSVNPNDILPQFLTNSSLDAELSPFPRAAERLKIGLERKLYYQLTRELADCNEEPYKYDIQRKVELLTGITDWFGVIRIVETMEDYSPELPKIWGNAKFVLLIRENMANKFVRDALKKLLDANTNPDPQSYIPSDIYDRLQSQSDDDGAFDWEQDWTDHDILLETLQILYVSKTIPEEFPMVLLRNSLKPDIQDILESAGALHYWNYADQLYNEPWDLYTIRCAVNGLMGVEISKKFVPKAILSETGKTKAPTKNNLGLLTLYHQIHEEKKVPKTTVDLDEAVKILIQQIKMSRLSVKYSEEIVAQFDTTTFPFLANRVEVWTRLFNLAETELKRELLALLSRSANCALPFIVQQTEVGGKFISFDRFIFTSCYPRIIPILRVGDSDVGKSSFLNQMWMKNKSSFVAKWNSSSKSDNLNGFVEYMWFNNQTANPDLWNLMTQNGSRDPVLLLNVHGDCLQLPNHLQFLAKIASGFIVFWMQSTWAELQTKKSALKSIFDPFQPAVFDLYVDPLPEVLKYVSFKEVLTTPFSIDSKSLQSNLMNSSNTLSMALHRRANPRPLSEEMENDDIATAQVTKEAEIIFTLIKRLTIQRFKPTMIQNLINAQSVNISDYWESNPEYKKIIIDFVAILNASNSRSILSDLSDLLSQLSDKETQNLRIQIEELQKDKYDISPLHKQNQLGRLRKYIWARSLSTMDLIFEVCKLHELFPELLTLEFDLPSFMAEMILECHTVPIPSSSSSFFTDSWMSETLGVLKEYSDTRVFVLNCLAMDSRGTSDVLNTLFGVSFTSYREQSFEAVGLSFRLVFLEDVLKAKCNVDAILVIQSKEICRPDQKGVKGQRSLDQKLATLMLVTGNMCLLKGNQDELSPILEMGLIAMSRMKTSQVPKLVFLEEKDGMTKDLTISEETLLQFFETVRTSLEDPIVSVDAVSTVGQQTVEKAIYDLKSGGGFLWIEKSDTFKQRYEDIKTLCQSISEERVACPLLPDWCNSLQNAWAEISNFDFPFQDFEDMKENAEYQNLFNELSSLLDLSFRYHTSEMESVIDKGLMEIYGYTDPDAISIEREIQILRFEITEPSRNIFRTCDFEKLDQEENDENEEERANENQCVYCAKALEREVEILLQLDSETRQNAFAKEIDSFVTSEIDHAISVGQQMFTVMLMERQSPEANRKSGDEGLSEKQLASTTRVVVPSARRMQVEIDKIFPNASWPIYDSDSMEGVAAFDIESPEVEEEVDDVPEEDVFLNWKEAAWLRNKISSIPTQTVYGRGADMYEHGMIWELTTKVDGILKTMREEVVTKPLLPQFRLHVLKVVIDKLRALVLTVEGLWNARYDPVLRLQT